MPKTVIVYPFEKATANTRLIGAEIALLVKRICEWTDAKPEVMNFKQGQIHGISCVSHLLREGVLDGPTDGRTDGWTSPLIEM